LRPIKKKIGALLLGADFNEDGLSVEVDWRYEMVVDYLRLSHSYKAVLLTMQGKQSPYPLPSDFAVVEGVVKDFQDVYNLNDGDWWFNVAKELFGIRAPATQVELVGRLAAENSEVTSKWQGNDTLVVNIPVTMKPSKALRQLQELISAQRLPEPLPLEVAPKYTISNKRFHEQSMNLGVLALRKYEQGMKLREIGEFMSKYREGYFEDTAVRRLIRVSALIAENAARGRFFSNKPFPEALIDTYQRTAGRPVGTKGIKWTKGRMSV
jgi:hypothetical protein